MRLGWTEIILIVILVMILFMANGINVFKKELKDTKKPETKKVAKKAPAKKSVKKK